VKLNSLFEYLNLEKRNENFEISSIQIDSRLVEKDSVFFLLKQTKFDSKYITEALTNGASLVITTSSKVGEKILNISENKIFDLLTKSLNLLYPIEKNKKIITVTGTNGKTTTCSIISNILEKTNKKVLKVGTLGAFINKVFIQETLTTPSIVDNFKLISNNEIDYAVFEASSHGLIQKRLDSIDIDIAIFSNLTRDHLDYHQNLENYFLAKRRLFDLLKLSKKKKKLAIINSDDIFGMKLINYCNNQNINYLTYGENESSDYSFKIINSSVQGMVLEISDNKTNSKDTVKLSLIGRHNAYNFSSAYIAFKFLNLDIQSLKSTIHQIHVAGRLEVVSTNPTIIVDYAHTPDALESVINSLNTIKNGRLFVLFGCGGDRDKGKRELMGEISSRLSDFSIITSDNPRFENPIDIINDIKKGLSNSFDIEPDRRSAIAKAIKMLKKDDILLIAGKGHEDYQIINDKKSHFSDKEEVLKVLQNEL